ncbi:hypothetical protein HAL1_06765 [Halomonas sp. HAL1]|nr:hypothetical protein HAL1_06765 [Halomonas sp. HAL1]
MMQASKSFNSVVFPVPGGPFTAMMLATGGRQLLVGDIDGQLLTKHQGAAAFSRPAPLGEIAWIKNHVSLLNIVAQVGVYWLVIWAMAYAPLGMVSALRETSVLFAALISTIILKEGFGVWRFVSSGLIACGIALTRYKP